MRTINICLPDAMKSFVDEQVARRAHETGSDYVRALIQKDQDRVQLRALLLQGAVSAPATAADSAYFLSLRDRIRKASGRVGTTR